MSNTTNIDASNGVFITFEGGDGAGKTTQVDLLCERLTARGAEVLKLHEPGGTDLGEKIRGLLLGKEQDNMDAMAELMLFEAARAQIVAEVIRPALAEGKVVICDRFGDSTVAYQGYGRELGAELVEQLNLTATGGLEPDCTIYLKLDPEFALQRAKALSADGEGDRMESAGSAFHQRVNDAFDKIAQSAGKRFVTVNASQSIEDVARDIDAALSSRVPELGDARG